MAPTLEVCVEGIQSALAAGAGGADRIEVCENLDVGGVTPSAGTIAVACTRLALPVHVLVRPRPGDFVYSAAEFEVMTHDIDLARTLGAAGVVFGLLTSERGLDRERTGALIARARPLSVTFHKAFDEVVDPLTALQELIELGVERVLTSGQARSAMEGVHRLGELSRIAAGRITIMPGGRIRLGDLPGLMAAGFREIHVGSAVCRDGRTDPDKVRRLVSALRARHEGGG